MFALYRKFKIGTIYSAQSLGSLGNSGNLLAANSSTKITFGNSTPDEMNWWMQEFGKRKETTIRYEVRPDGVYKKPLGGVYTKIKGVELANFRKAAKAYLALIKQNLYQN